MKAKQGFMAAVKRNFYIDLAKVKHDDPNIDKICKEMSQKKYLSKTLLKKKNLQRNDFVNVGEDEKQGYQK